MNKETARIGGIGGAFIMLVVVLVMIPTALFLPNKEAADSFDEYKNYYEDIIDRTSNEISRWFDEYVAEVAMEKAERIRGNYDTPGEISVLIQPGAEDLSLSNVAANKMMAIFHTVMFLREEPMADYEIYGEEYFEEVQKYASNFTDRKKCMFKCTVNRNIEKYEVITQNEVREWKTEQVRGTTYVPDRGQVDYTYERPVEVISQEEVREEHAHGTITVNISLNPDNFMKEELDRLMKIYGRRGSASFKAIAPEDATQTQRAIYEAAIDTPTTEAGYCAGWITNVFNASGLAYVEGNACDMWENYCDSDDYDDLDIGMIVAVRQSYSELGSIYGHVGIYIGNGQIIDSTGSVNITDLEDWIESYDAAGTVQWGYPEPVRSMVEAEKMEESMEAESKTDEKAKTSDGEGKKTDTDGADAAAVTDGSGSREPVPDENGMVTVNANRLRAAIVKFAEQWVGVTPYVHGGPSLETGTDCSGFLYLIFKEFGIETNTGSLAWQDPYFGQHVNYSDLLPGDVIVYGGGDHVALYAGDNMVIHCSSPDNGTVFWDMDYRADASAYIRVIDDSAMYTFPKSLLAGTIRSGKKNKVTEMIDEIANNLWLTFGKTGEDAFTKYEIDEEMLLILSIYLYNYHNIQNTPYGVALEASYLANCFELYGDQFLRKSFANANELTLAEQLLAFLAYDPRWGFDFSNNPRWQSPPESIVGIVRKVLVEGKRVLPAYVDAKIPFDPTGTTYTINKAGMIADPAKESNYVKFITNIFPGPDYRTGNELYYYAEDTQEETDTQEEVEVNALGEVVIHEGEEAPDFFSMTFYAMSTFKNELFCYTSEETRNSLGEDRFSFPAFIYMGDLEDDDNSSLRSQIVEYARSWIGKTPYVEPKNRIGPDGYYWNSLIEGTDCSGFLYLIFDHFHISVPTASDSYQTSVGHKISRSQLKPGDIIVYRNGGHVALYAGEGKIIHCANPDLGTIIADMDYNSNITAYVRVIDDSMESSFGNSFMGSMASEGDALDKETADEIFELMDDPTREDVEDALYELIGNEDDVIAAIAWVEGEADYSEDPYLGYLSAMAIINLIVQDPSFGNGNAISRMYAWGGGNDYYSEDNLYARYNNIQNPSTLKCLYMAAIYPIPGISACYGVDLAASHGFDPAEAYYISDIVHSEGQDTGVWRTLPDHYD